MSAPVPTGAIVHYTSSDWRATSIFASPDDVIHAVAAALTNNDGMKATGKSSVSFLSSIEGVASGYILFDVDLQVQVVGGLGYDSADDVAAIVNHEAYQATGYLPASYRIPDISLPGPGGANPQINTQCGTGVVETIKGWLGLCARQPSQSQPSGGFSLSNLTSSGTLYIGLAIFGFVAALALIGYSGALQVRRINVQ